MSSSDKTYLANDVLLVKSLDVEPLEDARRELLQVGDQRQETLKIHTLVVEQIKGAGRGSH